MARTFTGTVVSDKMQKTVVVMIERKFRHSRYQKIITKHKKFKAHNEDQSIKVGDLVIIQETKPMSKEKRFIVISRATPLRPVKAESGEEAKAVVPVKKTVSKGKTTKVKQLKK